MINNIILGATETTIYQTAIGKTFAVLSLIFCNTSAVDQVITVYAYPTGKSAVAGTTLIKNLTIPPEDTFVWDANEKLLLAAEDKISGVCSNAAVITVTYNGMEI